jgi:hypothetical protein
MIYATIKHSKNNREINISAKNMKELIDKKIPAWIPMLENDLPLLKQTERFKKSPGKEEANERKSGWYYDC